MTFLRNIKTLDSLKNPGYRIFYFGLLGQWAGMMMQGTAQSLLLYRLTGSAAILGIMALVSAAPQLVLALYGGVIADRFAKKYIIMVAQSLVAFSVLFVALTLSTGYLSQDHVGSWWVIIAASVIQNIAFAFMMPARQAIIPELAGKDKIMNAVALNTVGISIFQVVAPVASGTLIDAIDFTAIYYIMTVFFLIAVLFTSFIPVTRPTVQTVRQNTISNIKDGLKYTWDHPILLIIIGITLLSMILTSPMMTLMAIFADSILNVGATGLGVLQSISGISSLVVSLVMATMPSRRRGLLLIASGLVTGLLQILFAWSHSMAFSSTLMAVNGFAMTINMLAGTTLLQSYTEEAYLGRVLSIQMLSMGLGSLGSFASGILAEKIGIQWTVCSFAIVLVVISVLALIMLPKVRKLV